MRPSRDQWAMELAVVTAKRATCLRRHVGCVLVNARGHVIATGYNGVAAGLKHCNEIGGSAIVGNTVGINFPHACSGSNASSGQALDACQAIHAEQNALLQCRDVWDIHTCYVTVSPCITCVKLLLNTSCERIVFIEPYPHQAGQLWADAGRTWYHIADFT